MPTGLRNVVCDECCGGRMAFLATGKIQLEHDNDCMYKYREDTFLIDLCEELWKNNPKGPNQIKTYPEESKLNPIIYDMYCDGYYSRNQEKLTGPAAKKRAEKINRWLQIYKGFLKEEENNDS